jgi:hypothetical protein
MVNTNLCRFTPSSAGQILVFVERTRFFVLSGWHGAIGSFGEPRHMDCIR